MLNNEFNDHINYKINLYPEKYKKEIDDLNQYMYANINNGVYKCGFSTDQLIYEKEIDSLFSVNRCNMLIFI